jgi:hypothetical protein
MWNLPQWMTDIVLEGYSFQALCRKAMRKAIVVRKTVMAKMRGESPTRSLPQKTRS